MEDIVVLERNIVIVMDVMILKRSLNTSYLISLGGLGRKVRKMRVDVDQQQLDKTHTDNKQLYFLKQITQLSLKNHRDNFDLNLKLFDYMIANGITLRDHFFHPFIISILNKLADSNKENKRVVNSNEWNELKNIFNIMSQKYNLLNVNTDINETS
jgi:hypothetical protein